MTNDGGVLDPIEKHSEPEKKNTFLGLSTSQWLGIWFGGKLLSWHEAREQAEWERQQQVEWERQQEELDLQELERQEFLQEFLQWKGEVENWYADLQYPVNEEDVNEFWSIYNLGCERFLVNDYASEPIRKVFELMLESANQLQDLFQQQQREEAEKSVAVAEKSVAENSVAVAENGNTERELERKEREAFEAQFPFPLGCFMPHSIQQFLPMEPEVAQRYLDSEECPLGKMVGNADAIKILKWVLSNALGNDVHHCDVNLAFLGPSSSGKTMISRTFAEVLGTPHIEISPRSIKTVHDVFELIPKVYDPDSGNFMAYFCTVFLDEAHALPNNIEQALLKATERKDSMLVTEKGAVLDCGNICWHFATTDVGKMFDAFVNRFHPINLNLYTKDEIAEIINRNYPTWTRVVCEHVSRYCSRVPREALNFAQMVDLANQAKGGGVRIDDLAAEVARTQGIDQFGMSYRRVKILIALGRQPLSINQLCGVAGCKEEELRQFVLPWLMESTPDQEPYVVVTNRHYITRAGLAELDKRGIQHGGDSVLPS